MPVEPGPRSRAGRATGRGAGRATAAVLTLLAACGGSDGITDPPDGGGDPTAPQIVKGLALSPMGFPDTFDELPSFLQEAGSFPHAGVMWNGAWRDDVADGTDAGEFPAGALLTLLSAPTHGFAPILVFGWRGEAGPHIRIPANPDNSWANEEAAALYVSVVSEIAAAYEPPFLFLGNESDLYFDQEPADYARWITVYNAAYDAVKSASPETRVGPIFQYERMAGIGVLAGQTVASWGALTAHDLGRVDVLGLTVYPFFAHETPGEIPDGYFDPLDPFIGQTPLAITETGWPASIPGDFQAPWEGSEAHQTAYLDALGRILEGRAPPLVNWLFLHPPVEPSPGGLNPLEWNLFHSLSLRRASGEKRPVYDEWAAFTPGDP